MILVWTGLLLLALKWAEIGPFATMGWLWALAPLGIAIVWFEWGERVFGMDRRQIEARDYEQRRKERVEAIFSQLRGKGRRRRRL
jgi:small Trp-rich protein